MSKLEGKIVVKLAAALQGGDAMAEIRFCLRGATVPRGWVEVAQEQSGKPEPPKPEVPTPEPQRIMAKRADLKQFLLENMPSSPLWCRWPAGRAIGDAWIDLGPEDE